MITAQDKILHVANKLGLTSLKDMQASTGAVYDIDTDLSNQLFSNASRHLNPRVTNVTENQFEVNEALLIENIAFYGAQSETVISNFQKLYGSNAVLVFDLVIGNKRVMKNTPVFGSGTPFCFANVGKSTSNVGGDKEATSLIPRHQIYMEGVGILIPPQVQYYVTYNIFNILTGDVIAPTSSTLIACYLFGTKVNLNFNTSI